MSVSKELRQRIAEAAQYCCGYCQTQEKVSGIPLTLEHLFPKFHGGGDEESNLWLSCRLCNESKGILTEVADSQSGQQVLLFNPRTQAWTEHFSWDENGTTILGRTPEGRATVDSLKLNSNFRLKARAIWVEAGWHPPQL